MCWYWVRPALRCAALPIFSPYPKPKEGKAYCQFREFLRYRFSEIYPGLSRIGYLGTLSCCALPVLFFFVFFSLHLSFSIKFTEKVSSGRWLNRSVHTYTF